MLHSRDTELQILHERMQEVQRKVMNAAPQEAQPEKEPEAQPEKKPEAPTATESRGNFRNRARSARSTLSDLFQGGRRPPGGA